MKILGWAAGLALAIVIASALPSLSFPVGVLLGFGLSMFGLLIGAAAERR